MFSGATIRRRAWPIRQAADWLTPSVSARRTEDKPLSDCSNSHIAQPGTQGKFRGVQGRMCCRRKLETAAAAAALIQTRSRAALADVAASYRDRALVTTGGTDPAIRPYHTFQQTTAMLLVPKRGDHVINSPNIGKCCQHHFRHTYLQQDLPKNRMQVPILQEICCLSLIRTPYGFALLLFRLPIQDSVRRDSS